MMQKRREPLLELVAGRPRSHGQGFRLALQQTGERGDCGAEVSNELTVEIRKAQKVLELLDILGSGPIPHGCHLPLG